MSTILINPYRYAASSSFVPTDIAGIAGWWDASHAASFTFSSGSVVSQWNDRSGLGRHFAQGTVGAQPSRSGTQNSLSTVVFDGSTDYMLYDAGSNAIDISPWTFFSVCKAGSGSNFFERIMAARVSATGNADYQTGQAIFANRDNADRAMATSSGTNSGTKAWTANSWMIVRSTYDGNVTVAVNGSAGTGTAAAAPSNVRYLGLGTYLDSSGNPPAILTDALWTGEIAEVVLYNASLSAGDISTVETYLRTKWGTP